MRVDRIIAAMRSNEDQTPGSFGPDPQRILIEGVFDTKQIVEALASYDLVSDAEGWIKNSWPQDPFC